MSDSSVLDKFLNKRTDPFSPNTAADDDTHEDLGAFGFLRGTRDRALMLELRKKDNSVLAVGYAWLAKAEFDPSKGITLHVGGETIRILGRNLNAETRPNVRLFESITRHRVPWIREADQATCLESGPKGVLVEKIEW